MFRFLFDGDDYFFFGCFVVKCWFHSILTVHQGFQESFVLCGHVFLHLQSKGWGRGYGTPA